MKGFNILFPSIWKQKRTTVGAKSCDVWKQPSLVRLVVTTTAASRRSFSARLILMRGRVDTLVSVPRIDAVLYQIVWPRRV